MKRYLNMLVVGSLTSLLSFPIMEAWARASPPITKKEARAWPMDRVKRRVLEQLSDILANDDSEDTSGARRPPPVRPLEDFAFSARPRATDVPGLCRRDTLVIEFAPTKNIDRGADTPVRANGFRTWSQFHFLNPPPAHYDALKEHGETTYIESCARLGAGETRFFNADSAETATNGYWLAGQVLAAVHQGAVDFPITCNVGKERTPQVCKTMMSDLSVTGISSIERCSSDLPDLSNARCFSIMIGGAKGDFEVRMFASNGSSAKNAPPPMTIVHVRIDEVIVLADERLD